MLKRKNGIVLVLTICLLVFSSMVESTHAEMVAHWTFDQCNANDSSGNGHNGTLVGSPICVDRADGKAYELDGAYGNDEYINIGTDTDFDLTDFSICAWVYPSATDTGGVILAKARSYSLRVTTNETETGGRLKIGVWMGGHATFDTEENTVPVDQWSCVCGTYDAGDQGEGMKLYINGQLLATNPNRTTTPSSNNNPVTIGWEETNNSYYNGRLDEVKLYNHALSQSEITDVCNSDPTNTCNCSDTDKDGVPDAWDACSDTPQGSATDAVGCPKRAGVVVIPMD